MVRSSAGAVKLLGNGELTSKLTIEVHKATGTARKAVEAAGGTLTELLAAPAAAE